jgi:hypothetical protein
VEELVGVDVSDGVGGGVTVIVVVTEDVGVSANGVTVRVTFAESVSSVREWIVETVDDGLEWDSVGSRESEEDCEASHV